jgi:hypothetical protein
MRCPTCNALVMPGDKRCRNGHSLAESALYDPIAEGVQSARKEIQAKMSSAVRGLAPSPPPAQASEARKREEVALVFEGKFPAIVNMLLCNAGFPSLPMGIIRNPSDEPLSGGVLRLALKPEGFIDPIEDRLPDLPGGKGIALDPRRPAAWNYQAFRALDESVQGLWEIEARRGEELLGKWSSDVTIHPLREWVAHPATRDSLAGLVTPNDPAVKEFISGLSRDFPAYQGESAEQVLAQVAALYEAVRARGFHYIENPPSYENTGQKVRFPCEILEQKQGTCLDFCVFMAALLEYVRLHPLIMLIPGHAFHGLWLQNSEPLDKPLMAEQIQELVGAGEIFVFNSTNYFAPEDSLEKAVDLSLAFCRQESDLSAIDIHTCRAKGIKPVPLWR